MIVDFLIKVMEVRKYVLKDWKKRNVNFYFLILKVLFRNVFVGGGKEYMKD